MYLKKIEISRTKKDGSVSQRVGVLHRFKCDSCGKEYEKKSCNVSKSKSGLHFCNNACKFTSHTKGGALRNMSEQTSIKNFGVTIPMQSSKVKDKRVKTLQKRYGENVVSALQIPGAKEKRRRTHLERYGVEETFQCEALKEKRRITWTKRYGVPYKPIFQNREALELSMMKMPNKWSSNVEIQFCEFLSQTFDEVIRQKRVTKWPIDAYIPSIDTYVQFDGVYWHGLDRDISIIRESTKPRDKAIYNKWLNDREQDTWFRCHNLKLIRITDVEFKLNPTMCIERIQNFT